MSRVIKARKRPTKEIARELPNWRKRHKLSQSEAASKLRVSRRTLQEWEQGRARPRHLALEALRTKIAR